MKKIDYPTKAGLYVINIKFAGQGHKYYCLIKGLFPFLEVVIVFTDIGTMQSKDILNGSMVDWYEIEEGTLDYNKDYLR